MICIRSSAQVAINAFIIILVLVFFRSGLMPINKQGFFCDDQSIGYPVLKETISGKSMDAIGFLLIPAFILSVETLASIESIGWLRRPNFRSNGCRRFTHVFLAYWYGAICGVVMVYSLKHVVGELRPNFLDVCKPDFSGINCSQGYITEYNCTSDVSPAALKDAYKSFPSGHAAAIFYEITFLILYLRRYLEACSTALVPAIVNVALVAFAVFCSSTRIIERQHHWWDVVFGAIVGSTVAIYAAFVFLLKNDYTDASTAQRSLPAVEENKSSDNHSHRPVEISDKPYLAAK